MYSPAEKSYLQLLQALSSPKLPLVNGVGLTVGLATQLPISASFIFQHFYEDTLHRLPRGSEDDHVVCESQENDSPNRSLVLMYRGLTNLVKSKI
jgi:hypothetical protein